MGSFNQILSQDKTTKSFYRDMQHRTFNAVIRVEIKT